VTDCTASAFLFTLVGLIGAYDDDDDDDDSGLPNRCSVHVATAFIRGLEQPPPIRHLHSG